LEAAHAVISNNQNREDKKLWSQRVEGPTPQVIELTDEEHEGQFVANQMAQLFQTGAYKYTQMAILYRRNSQSRALEQELMRKGIPYHIARGTKFFERAEIRDLMAYMMVLQNPQNTSAFLRCIGSPKRGVGESSAEKVIAEARRTGLSILEAAKSPVVLGSVSTAARKGLGAFNRMMETGQTMFSEQGPSAILSFLLEESGLKASIESQGGAEGRDRLDNLQELVSLARDMDTLPPPDGVVKFLDDVQLLSDSDGVGEKKPGVTLLTVHSSKGLEYSVVFVTGLEEGTFPDYKNLEGEKLEEERRLAYVALTRAKDHLFLTYCRTRNFFGREQILEPSEFLAEIPNELVNKRRLAKTVGRKAQIFPHRGGTGNSFSFPKKSGPGGQGFPGRGF
jgi:DNA helicase-2/ATP-dependent DNA helicase PcrA